MMLDFDQLSTLSASAGVSADVILHEEYEILVLNELFNASWGSEIAFMGGTALRLCHGSARYSEDLDFAALKTISPSEFKKTIESLKNLSPFLTIRDIHDKFNTQFAILKIKEPFLKMPISVKIEISKRKTGFKKHQDYEVMQAKSPHFPFSAYGFCLTLPALWREKMKAWEKRRYPRDYFDLWFIKNNLKNKKLKNQKLSHEMINRDMHRLLSVKDWKMLRHVFV